MGKTNTNWKAVQLFSDRAKTIDSKEHFRLKKYDVTVKEVAKVRFGGHCKYNINYHFVWIPKTRMKILVEPFKSDVDAQIQQTSEKYGWHTLALEIMPDHIHFFVSAHPKWAPMRVVQLVKQETSRKLREKYSILNESGTACQTGNIQEIERKILHPKGHTHPLQRHSIRERCSGFLGDRLLLWNCWPCLSGPGSTLYSGADEATKEGLEAL